MHINPSKHIPNQNEVIPMAFANLMEGKVALNRIIPAEASYIFDKSKKSLMR